MSHFCSPDRRSGQCGSISGGFEHWILHWGQKNMMIVSDMDAAPAETARYSCVFGWLPEGCTLVRSVYEEMEVSYTVYRNNEAAGSIRIMPLDAVQLNDTDAHLSNIRRFMVFQRSSTLKRITEKLKFPAG